MIVDYFPYFNERELLELRINLLQDHVDHFVVVEADQTFSGLPRTFQLNELITELGLPRDRFTVIEWRHASNLDLQLEQHDFDSMYPEDRADLASIQAVARERTQRNALLTVLDQFDSTDWIIMSDCDEIINPAHISFAVNVAGTVPNKVVKLPLINLYGRADLRPYSLAGWPYTWRTAMSICCADVIAQTTPHRIRCGYHLPVETVTPTLDGAIFDEFGWHFSWMGGEHKIRIKSESYAHAPNQGHQQHRDRGFKFEENVCLTWNSDSILRRFPQDQLPDLIFDLPHIRQFLLPD